MSDFSFAIECDRNISWVFNLDGKAIKLKLDTPFSENIKRMLRALTVLHPDYDKRRGIMRLFSDKRVPYREMEISFDKGRSVLYISAVKNKDTKLDRILYVRIQCGNKTHETEISYLRFAQCIMYELNELIWKTGAVNYQRKYGEDFPLTELIKVKALLMDKSIDNLANEVGVLSYSFYVSAITEPIRKMTLISNNRCYGADSDIKIFYQSLSICNDGKVDITTEDFYGKVLDINRFEIDEEYAKDFISELVDYFKCDYEDLVKPDIGAWALKLCGENGGSYTFKGVMEVGNDGFLNEYSKRLRELLRRGELLIFNGMGEKDIIFLSCEFKGSGRSYYYRTDDYDIDIGYHVRVPVGKNGRTAIVEVVDVEYFSEDELPMPLDEVKEVIEVVHDFEDGDYY